MFFRMNERTAVYIIKYGGKIAYVLSCIQIHVAKRTREKLILI